MEQIWLSACMEFEIPDSVAKIWLDKIKTRMSTESGRIVHTWEDMLEPKAEYLSSAKAVLVFAVCFQYFEFDVKRSCAEENCKAFRDFCKEATFTDEACIKKVERLLGNDSAEAYAGLEDDMAVMQDVDLIVLGLPEDQYKNYTQLLRKEYPHLDDTAYKNMRLKILQTFLMIPTIYATDPIREKLEEKARQNIRSEIEYLKKE